MAQPPREAFSQATFKAIRDKIENIAADGLEDRLKNIASYAVDISPEDTGAYVESFSMGKAGFSGGRMKSSAARGSSADGEGAKRKANGASKEIARGNLLSDIQGMNVKQMLETGDVKFTLRNRAEHAINVENGENWKRDGYHVFRKIKRRFNNG